MLALRLGHPNLKILNYICNKPFITFDSKSNNSEICTSCQMEKASKLPFHTWDHSVHILSIKYIITCGDKHILFIEISLAFMWYSLIDSQISHSLYHLGTNMNALLLLFSSISLSTITLMPKFEIFKVMKEVNFILLFSLIIFAQMTFIINHCPKTLEHNGKSERKHRSITNLGLTMLFHAKLPTWF